VTPYDVSRHAPHTCAIRRQSEGASVVDLGIVSDDEASVEGMIDKALAQGARVLVTSGGVSMVCLRGHPLGRRV
jgi:molybdopterin biosynthesis enzyme